MGYCAGYPSPGFTRGPPAGWFGRGRGRGRGMGRGWWRGWIYPPYYQDDFPQPAYPPEAEGRRETERAYLEETVRRLEEELATIRKRLDDLSSE